jgi:hypothetical protein
MELTVFLLCLTLGASVFGHIPNFIEESSRPISCPQKGHPSNPCDGLTCLVNDADECRQVMRNNNCGVAFYKAGKNQSDQFECKMVFGRDPSIAADSHIHFKANVNNILFFKMYSGVRGGQEPANAFLSGSDSVEILFPRTKSSTFSSGNYYKSPLWNIREKLGISTVTVAMHGNLGEDGADTCELTFAHANAANGQWFSNNNLVGSYPFPMHQMKGNGYSFFDIKGWNSADIGRQFYVMYHGGCPGDVGPMAVIVKQDPCSWGNTALPLPRFMCAASWLPINPFTGMQPNMNTHGRFMRELEVTGRLLKPVHVLYAGPRDG